MVVFQAALVIVEWWSGVQGTNATSGPGPRHYSGGEHGLGLLPP